MQQQQPQQQQQQVHQRQLTPPDTPVSVSTPLTPPASGTTTTSVAARATMTPPATTTATTVRQPATSTTTRTTEHGSSSPSGATENAPALGVVLQQLLAAVERLDTRVGSIEAAAAASGDSPPPAAPRPAISVAGPPTERAPTARARRAGPAPDPDDSGDDDSSGSDGGGDTRRPTPARSRRDERERSRRRNLKDLELPTFTPSPNVLVSTWIDRVDLTLKGAAQSGRGTWSDEELYYILGNKLMDSASRWWVVMNRKWRNSERTWTNLKAGLLRRYGERLDVSAAEWRVNQRIMMPGETYADFAAGLRDTTGRDRVEERVLLAQFYKCLSLTVRQLVKQRDPETLEEAVDHATEIDDTNANVAKGMQNIGQPFATAPSPCMVSMNGTAEQMLVVPGVTGTGIMVDGTTAGTVQPGIAGSDASTMALFTNPQGIWNDYTGWAVPKDRTWNGKFWAEPAKKARKIKKMKA
ncbi:hypothetical protein PR003_g25221, partial [Phytophthora rubi]